ncbi:MAG: acyl-CoA dehydrogenase family protein [Desulfobacterales bacterium]|nr:acyl-CoA dehydrogenase family protein [Desulfobacterales bacterium]
MDFEIPGRYVKDLHRFKEFLDHNLDPQLSTWYQEGAVPRSFFSAMGQAGWLGVAPKKSGPVSMPACKWALLTEQLAVRSPGVAVAVLAHVDLGLKGLLRFGPGQLLKRYGPPAARGEIIFCLGNSERHAGSDVAAIAMGAKKIQGGWRVSGTKAYVTNGLSADFALVTAVTEPDAQKNSRISMFLVDLAGQGVSRTRLNKRGWVPSDLTRLRFDDVFVPDDHLVGKQGRGLQQVLEIFAHSRVLISALTLGTAVGAFDTAFNHAGHRKIFGRKVLDFQAKAFEIADMYTKIEAARLMLGKACSDMDRGGNVRLSGSMSKYFSVKIAREVAQWAADLFGAASIMQEHPIHKFPLDVWAASLGEGTQDVQKLVIFREVVKQYGVAGGSV